MHAGPWALLHVEASRSTLKGVAGAPMKHLGLSTVGALCAVLLVVCFVLGSIAMASSGVQVLIPETGPQGRDWIANVDATGGLFFLEPGSSS
jgi:hypothetical protein